MRLIDSDKLRKQISDAVKKQKGKSTDLVLIKELFIVIDMQPTISEQEIRNKAIDEFLCRLEKHEQENWVDHQEYGITWDDIEEIAERVKGEAI